MGLRDPIAAYNASTNIEAHLVKLLLTDAGVEAFVSEDLSTGGLWMCGLLPEIHKPQVWVSAADVDRAQTILEDYEWRAAERSQAAPTGEPSVSADLDVLCEECKRKSVFPSSQRGTIQDCPHCGAYVDVGEIDSGKPFWPEGDEPDDA